MVTDVIPERKNRTNCVCWTGIRYASGFLRRSSRVRPRPLLFNLYTADIHLLVAAHGLVLHQYADDGQIYIATPAKFPMGPLLQSTGSLAVSTTLTRG